MKFDTSVSVMKRKINKYFDSKASSAIKNQFANYFMNM